MSWASVLALMFASKVGLLLTALPVAFVFFIINIVGSYLIFGGFAGLEQMVRNEQLSVAQFSLVPIPFFVLMGEVLFHTGLAMKSIDAVDAVIHRVPGRLAVVALVAGTVFSAISGSTIATTAMLGSLLLPQMLQRNYEPKTAMGPILAIGGVDILIPPSGLAVLLGSLAGISISGLLVGGIVPGLILSALFIGYVLVRCWLNPALAPAFDDGRPRMERPWLNLAVTILPLIGVFAIVVISMTGGWATPTESSALGAVATVLLAACYGCLTWQSLWKSLLGTVSISGSLLFIIVGATTFAQLLSFSGATAGLVALIERLAVQPSDDSDRDAGSPAHSWILHRSNQHHDGYAAVLHAAAAQHGGRSDLVRHSLSALHADRAADAAVRAPAVCAQRRGATRHHDRNDI